MNRVSNLSVLRQASFDRLPSTGFLRQAQDERQLLKCIGIWNSYLVTGPLLEPRKGGIISALVEENDNTAVLAVSRLEHVLGWVVAATAMAVAIVLFIYVGDGLSMPVTLIMVAVMLLLVGLAWLLYRMLRYRSVLDTLHAGILRAQEGTLEPVEMMSLPEGHMRRLVADYNLMMAYLQRIFATVEECQNRVLAERNKINAMLQSLPCALLSVDNDLQISAVNALAESMFQISEKTLIGSSLFDLLELGELDRALLRDAFLYKRRISNQEIETRLGDDSLVHISLNLSFIIENDANMDAVITLQDISDYKRLQENVYGQEKLVAMGELAAGVAHELNTPLGNILGYAQLVRDAMSEDQKLQQWVRTICDEARRCSRIIDDLLHYARREECTEETCDINSVVTEVTETYVNCRIKRYNISVELDLVPLPLQVEGSCGQLDIVLVNLLSNSIQALVGRSAPLIKLSTRLTKPDVVTLIVEDNGGGVPREVRGRIFDPFFTTKDVGSGTGLGLAICHAVLKRRGASIRYDNNYSAGARFIIELPYVRLQEMEAVS